MQYGVSIISPWYSASIDTKNCGFGEKKFFRHTFCEGVFKHSSSFSSFNWVFFSDFKWDRQKKFWCMHANTKTHISEHSWLSCWAILSVLAHLAHLAQSYFSLIFSAINAYNCSQFDLTNNKICNDWRQKLAEKWPMLVTFFLTAISSITGSDNDMY